MKKFVFSVLCLTLFVSVALLAIGCNQSHTHSFTEQTVKDEYLSTAASCTDKAKYFYSCSCGEKGTETFEYGSPLGHEFTSYISDNNATCTQDGTKTAKCNRCDVTDTITDGGSVKGHTVVIDEAKAATCTESGLTEGKHCSVCNAVLEEQDVIPAKGHTYSAEWSYNETEHWHAATCGHNVKKDTIKHSFDENKKCTVCDYVTTKPLGIELQSSVFDINLIKKTGYIKVSNSIADYDFSDKFIVADGAGFDVYTDKQCNNKIASKNVDIVAGDNVFYVLVTNDGDMAIYTLTIRRKPIYTVSFDTNGGSIIQSQQVEEDSFAVKPETPPTRPGYTFSGWNFDFSTPITENKTVAAIYTVRQYKISVTPSVSDICKLSGDGDYDYDSTVSLSISNVYLGYEFCGWYNGDTLLSVDYDYTFNMPADDITITARLAVKQEMQIYNFTSTTDTCEIDSVKDETIITSVVIPEYVTAIGDYAFYGCSGLTSIIIGNSVTTIGRCAFRDCVGLTSVTISDSVATLGENAFYGCSGLTNVTIPDSVTSIGDGVFVNCRRLTSVIIGSGVISIANFTFSGCISLTSIEIPDNVISIDQCAFYNCSGLTSITIPDSVTSIEYSALKGCDKLANVYIADISSWCTIDGLDNLMWCSRNKNLYLNNEPVAALVIPDSVTAIKEYTFYGFSALTSITIPDSVTSIGKRAFYECGGLICVTIGCSVSAIGVEAFRKCDKLTSLEIPDSVSSMGEYAFSDCSGLISVTIGKSITSIADYAFSGCSGLTNVTIESNVSTIGAEAFSNCSKLASIIIPDSVTSIKKSAFRYCSGLTSIIIPDSVTTMGEYAFSECSKLTSVTIGKGITSIADSAFSGCIGLTSIEIPDNVISIDQCAFYECSGLMSVAIPESVVTLGSYAFEYCSGLTSIIIPDSVTTIGEYVFSECSGLTNVTIPDSVTSIGNCAFSNCSGLISVTIGKGVTSIGDEVFAGCLGLTCIEVPDNVTSIGQGAFSYCNELISVTIGSNVTTIADYAFYGCNGLKEIHFKGSKTQWNAIKKSNNWNDDTGNYVIICIDGTISK